LTTTPLTDRSQEFIESILRLEPRFAAFDCDGTLWSGDGGERFFAWELEEKLVPDDVGRAMQARYTEYQGGRVSEEVMCGEMVTMHRGMIEADVQRAATRFFDLYFVEQIFSEMRSLVRQLMAQGCNVWAVSSTNDWVIRAGMRHFGIPRDRVLAASVEIENMRITDRIIRIPSGPGKPQAILDVVGKKPDAAFGNSCWDVDMLNLATRPYVINPNPDLKELAGLRGWPLYFPSGVRK